MRDKDSQYSLDYYKSSQEYHCMLSSHSDDHYTAYLETVKKWIPVGSKILEVGSSACQAARMIFQEGYDIYVTDASPLFLYSGHQDEPQLPYSAADILHLPFQEQSFDAVISNEVIEHLTNVPSSINEMTRLVRSGGWIIILAPGLSSPLWPVLDLPGFFRGKWRPPHYQNWKEATSFFWCNIVRSIRIILSAKPIFESREPDFSYPGGDTDATYWSSALELARYLKKHGFRILNMSHMNGIFSRSWLLAKTFPGITPAIALVAQRMTHGDITG